MHYEGVHFTRLVEHLGRFPGRRRKSLARLYGARGERPEEIAVAWCENPERVRQIAAERFSSDAARRVLRDLAFDHDIVIPIDWVDRGTKKALDTLGFIQPLGEGGLSHIENMMPAGLAAILSPMFEGVRTTLPLLLGAAEPDVVRRIASNHGLDPDNPVVPLALSLSEILSDVEVIEEFAETHPDPELIGPAMMALELGGLCYWQEIFGFDLDGPGEDGEAPKVVAFMRPDERHAEQNMAQTLLDHGICFRVDRGEDYPMLVVPEELWVPLWELGRRWLLEWTASSWAMTDDQGSRRTVGDLVDTHAGLKLLVCEADAGRLPAAPSDVTDDDLTRWMSLGWGDETAWRAIHRMGWELGAWSEEEGRGVFNPTATSLLDAARTTFIRSVLLEWVTGYAGAWSDSRLATAIGLDEVWRNEVLRRLIERSEFAPGWMHFAGIDPQQTGAGCLRTVSREDPDDLLMFEMSLANGLVWTEKLLWLDLMSMLESGRWYPLGQLAGLLQMAASVSVFGQLLHVLQNPSAGYYIPVQRASFLIDPVHDDAVYEWTSDLVEHLLEPLGAAQRDGDLVWLDTTAIRIPTPPGLTDDGREVFMRDIFADPELEFRVPNGTGPVLRTVPDEVEGAVDTSLPLATIRAQADGREITAFDGRYIELS